MNSRLSFLNLWHAFALVVLACLSISQAAAATTYYVATDGNDANSGVALATPFRTISKAANKALAGDTVLIRGGTYREQVDMGTGGSAGNYLTIAAYNGEVPVIKGSEVVTGWTQHSGAIWKKTGWGINSQQVFVDFDSRPGKPLQQIGMPSSFFTTFEYNAAVGSGLSSMTAGTFYYDGSTLYVWLADGSSPNSHVMEASTKMRLLFMAAPYVYVKGLTFRHSNATAFAQQGVAVELSSNSIIENSDIQWTDFGGLGMGYLQNNAQAINNTVNNNGSNGISAGGSTAFKVSQNRMNGNNYRNFNPLWHAGGFKGAAKAYGTIEANEVGNNNGSGIWCDYCNGGGQIVVRNNYIHDNGPKDSAIFLEVSTNALIYNNVLVNNERRGIYLSASDRNQVMNNTIAGTRGVAAIEVNGMPRDGGTLTNNTVYNNIISGSTTQYDLYIAAPNGSTISGNKSDYNAIYRGGQPLALASAQFVSTLAAWRTATGYDLNSISADPAFIGTGSATAYGVRDGSPVIDTGMNLAGLVVADYSAGSRPVGAGYDIGAFEKGSTGTTPTPAPVPAPTPTPTPTPTTGKDTTPPVVTLGALTPTAVGGSARIEATATDNVGVTEMSLMIDGTKKTGSTTNQVSYVWDLANVRVGTHEIRVSGSDAAGNTGAATANFTVLEAGATSPTPTPAPTPTPTPTPTTGKDTTPPVVTVIGPGNGSTVTGTVVISATATDNVGVTEMTILVDGTAKAKSSTGSISYNWKTAGLRAGSHSIRISAGDAAQNTGVGNISVTVK
jgi:parallel beta-helix repeat protein